MTREDWSRSWRPWLRGTALGFPAGVLPAGGSEIPTFLSYALERRLARRPAAFWQRSDRRRCRPRGGEQRRRRRHAGSAPDARPPDFRDCRHPAGRLSAIRTAAGPLLFTRDAQLVWGLIASLYIGNVMLLVLNLPLVGLWVRLLAIPRPYLHAGILVLASVGGYSVNRSIFDVALLYAIGELADAMLGDPAGTCRHRRHPRPDGRATLQARARGGGGIVDDLCDSAYFGDGPVTGCGVGSGAFLMRAQNQPWPV